VTAAPRLLLASTSPYRRALLERLGLEFEVVSPGVAERSIAGEAPGARAVRLALAKARAVADRHPDALVIGSDQVAAAGDRVLDKPGAAERARAQLAALSGHSAHFYTACALLGGPADAQQHLDITTVVFRALDADEIARYVTRERPFDCAGSFKAESLGIALFERIESQDPTAIIGLPLIWLAQALRRAGCDVP
jgi:septum formation protein